MPTEERQVIDRAFAEDDQVLDRRIAMSEKPIRTTGACDFHRDGCGGVIWNGVCRQCGEEVVD